MKAWKYIQNIQQVQIFMVMFDLLNFQREKNCRCLILPMLQLHSIPQRKSRCTMTPQRSSLPRMTPRGTSQKLTGGKTTKLDGATTAGGKVLMSNAKENGHQKSIMRKKLVVSKVASPRRKRARAKAKTKTKVKEKIKARSLRKVASKTLGRKIKERVTVVLERRQWGRRLRLQL